MKYAIEKINGDNRRPGMPTEGYLVRYDPHESFGWMCRKCFPTLEEAESFGKSKE